MIKKFKNWIKTRFSAKSEPERPSFRRAEFFQNSQKPASQPKPEAEDVEFNTKTEGKIEDAGPGKNVLIRNKYVREDTGTHETLKILDDSLVDSGEETGIDPYNTGGFDRSKNWNNRFRK